MPVDVRAELAPGETNMIVSRARALLVSHWTVNTNAALDLTTRTAALMDEDKDIGRSEAMRRAIKAMIEDAANDEVSANDKIALRLHPSYWAAFSIVGEGGRSRAKAPGSSAGD